MLVFYRTSKNTYRRMIEGVGTKEVYHSIRAIMAAYDRPFKVYTIQDGQYFPNRTSPNGV